MPVFARACGEGCKDKPPLGIYTKGTEDGGLREGTETLPYDGAADRVGCETGDFTSSTASGPPSPD